jgi:hypothetical protein
MGESHLTSQPGSRHGPQTWDGRELKATKMQMKPLLVEPRRLCLCEFSDFLVVTHLMGRYDWPQRFYERAQDSA